VAIERADAATLYEKVYCARGAMETESGTAIQLLRRPHERAHDARQRCVHFSADAYILPTSCAEWVFEAPKLEHAYVGPSACAAKVAGRLTVSVRRIRLAFSAPSRCGRSFAKPSRNQTRFPPGRLDVELIPRITFGKLAADLPLPPPRSLEVASTERPPISTGQGKSGPSSVFSSLGAKDLPTSGRRCEGRRMRRTLTVTTAATLSKRRRMVPTYAVLELGAPDPLGAAR